MNQGNDQLGTILKQLQALFPALVPFISANTQINLTPFLNPQISVDLWPITSALALIASFVVFNLSKRGNYVHFAAVTAFVGFALALFALVTLVALETDVFLRNDPQLQDFFVRISYVLLFVGMGLSSGWGFAKFLI